MKLPKRTHDSSCAKTVRVSQNLSTCEHCDIEPLGRCFVMGNRLVYRRVNWMKMSGIVIEEFSWWFD